MAYGLWYKIPANQLGKSKNVWPIKEYGLYLVCVRRESTVVHMREFYGVVLLADAYHKHLSVMCRRRRAGALYAVVFGNNRDVSVCEGYIGGSAK